MVDAQVKRKIISSPHARVNYPSRPSSPTRSKRSPSPARRVQLQSTVSSSAPDAPRLRAKVSSSAHVSTSKRPTSLAPGYASGTSTPRAPSPVKQHEFPQFPQGNLSPKPDASTISRVRSKAALSAVSAPNSPRIGSVKSQYASLSAATSDSVLARPGAPRARNSSMSSMSQLSFASSPTVNDVRSPGSSVVSYSQDSDTQSNVSTQRIKAKVSSMAKEKSATHTSPNPPPLLIPSASISPPTPTTSSPSSSQIHQRGGRTASIGSLPNGKIPPIYPITTANPAANVHRFATARTPSASYRPPHSFRSPLQLEHKPASTEPALVPLPPLSPPSSNLSFSSRSSVSRSSVSPGNNAGTSNFNPNVNGSTNGLTSHSAMDAHNGRSKSRSNSLVVHDENSEHHPRGDSSEPDTDGIGEEGTLKAKAKSHRKIADLEITTKSLLAINTQLEANKHKQAKEIRDLRRKLRESQLALPPRAFRELKSTDGLAKDEDDSEEQEEERVDEESQATEIIRLGKDDESFDRVRLIIDNLLESGRQALASKVEDFAPPKGAAKVLHEVEARTWRDGGESRALTPSGHDNADDPSFDESLLTADSGDEATPSRRLSAVLQNQDNSMKSEGEVEELVGNLRSSLSATLCP